MFSPKNRASSPQQEQSTPTSEVLPSEGLTHFHELIRCVRQVNGTGISLHPMVQKTALAVLHATERASSEDLASRTLSFFPIFGDPTQNKPLNLSSDLVHEKSPGDFVTQMDLLLDKHLTAALKEVRDVPLISEEGSDHPDIASLPEAWVLDPLDGTTAYRCGEPSLCGPMVAFTRHGRPEFSVMLTMDGEKLALAQRGKRSLTLTTNPVSSWCSHAPVSDTPAEALSEGRIIINSQSDARRSDPAFLKFWDRIQHEQHAMTWERRVPHGMAALALTDWNTMAIVHDNSAAFPKQLLWDVLPVKLWVEGIGGVFWGFDGKPYSCDRPQPIIVARSAAIAERIIELSR